MIIAINTLSAGITVGANPRVPAFAYFLFNHCVSSVFSFYSPVANVIIGFENVQKNILSQCRAWQGDRIRNSRPKSRVFC